MDPDTDVAGWVLNFLLRQPTVRDGPLTSLLSSLPSPSNNVYLSKAIHLRRIQVEIAKDAVSEVLLDLLELVYALDHVATEAMRCAYCCVAVVCTVRAGGDVEEVAKRVWRERVESIGECGLVSFEFVEWRDVIEPKVGDSKGWERLMEMWTEGDALRVVREYVEEAWAGLGSTFIEAVAGDGGAREALLGLMWREGDGNFRAGEINKEVVLKWGTLESTHKHVAKKHSTKSVAGASRGAKITDPEEENQAVMNDPLPEALELDENVIAGKNIENRNQEVQEKNVDLERPCTSYQNNAPKPCSMSPNSIGQAYQEEDSIDNVRDGESGSKVNLPSPKNRVLSLKEHEVKNRRGRRKFWSSVEEDTLIAGVKKYGKGSWKAILNAYRDVFAERTDVDLKDKWRNMTK